MYLVDVCNYNTLYNSLNESYPGHLINCELRFMSKDEMNKYGEAKTKVANDDSHDCCRCGTDPF